MKNKYYFLLIWLISLSGCKKFLQEDPQGILVGDIALSNENGLEAQLAGAYSPLMQAWSSGFASSAQIGLSMGGDDVTTHPVSNKEDFRQFDQLAVHFALVQRRHRDLLTARNRNFGDLTI